ncbi:MAG: hypothetical protein JRF57_15615 [Deltaproteobacteria bacterium]|nr:hypothetical protein [Deltaproteobacteria bacterium]
MKMIQLCSGRVVMLVSVLLWLFLGWSSYNVLASEPTFADCKAWIQAHQGFDFPNHGCEKQAGVLKTVREAGGGFIPIDAGRFFIVWFPDDWNKQRNKRLIVALHGSGGCAERMFKFWHVMRSRHSFAVAAVQYAEVDAAGNLRFDDSARIYELLRATLNQLKSHCPLDGVPVVLYGFSKGSARTFELAAMDRAPEGMKAFSAFISDSGAVFAEYQGQLSPFLQHLGPSAYRGAHFWLYCGGKDHGGRTCRGMKRMAHFVRAHGGTVDRFYTHPPGGHGIFITGRPQRLGGALTALFDYINQLGNQ